MLTLADAAFLVLDGGTQRTRAAGGALDLEEFRLGCLL